MAKSKKMESTETPIKSLFALKQPLPWQLKYVALMDNTTQAEIVNEALTDYMQRWEKKNGPIPKK